MSIEIKSSLANQIRAYHAQHPDAAALDIAHALQVRAVLVRNALGRKLSRRIKSVAKG